MGTDKHRLRLIMADENLLGEINTLRVLSYLCTYVFICG